MEGPNKIKFFVRDTGIGISKADLLHVFEKFYRSEDYRTRETSGTGLGLYVVKKLADKLDTEIDVQSRLNNGSTFSFIMGLKTRTIKSNEDNKGEESVTVPTEAQEELVETK